MKHGQEIIFKYSIEVDKIIFSILILDVLRSIFI